MNNEIEVGEWIRTEDGQISKNNSNYNWDLKETYINDSPVIKHSKIKSEIVEVGDYVNGSKVLEIMEDMNTGEIHLEMTSNYTNQEIGDCTIYDKDIKSIVTKEAFKEREYIF